MNILAVCQHYYPENFQITPICEQLVKDGHNVTVLAGLPNYPKGEVPAEYKRGHREETINGVHVVRCFEIGRKKGAFHLAVNYVSFLLSSLYKVNKIQGDFDVVFSYQLSPILMALPARKYAKRHHLPLFLYCCDLWPESLKVYTKNEKNPLFQLMMRVSKGVYRACDRIAVQSVSFLSYLHETHGVPQERMLYLPAFADEAYLDMDFTPENNGVVDFVFMGNLGIAQNLMTVLEAVERMRDIPGFLVHFVGDGSCLEDMKAYVREHRMEDIVRFYGRRPVEEMPSFYKLADACLLSLKADSQVGFTMPAKTQGYMAAGKPILGMIDGSANHVIKQAECGVCVGSDDVNGFAGAMIDFIMHPESYKTCGENGRRYFKENFRKSIFITRLEDEMRQLCED